LIAAAIVGLLPLSGLGQGLQMTLTTSGTAFTVVDQPAAGASVAAGRAWQTQRDSIVAAATLTNFSNTDVTIHYDHIGMAANRFQFQVVNSAGDAVWLSEAFFDEAPVILPDQAVLKKRASFRRTVRIPLRVGDSWLPTGRYTLIAYTGARGPQATSIFDVISPVPSIDTGLRGTVGTYNGTAHPDPVQATVRVVEVRPSGARSNAPLFTWTGSTDAQGQFQVVTPPGTFSVSASPLAATPGDGTTVTLVPTGTVISIGQLPIYYAGPLIPAPNSPRTVQVIPGQFTTCNLVLPRVTQPNPNLIPTVTSAKLINLRATASIPPTLGFEVQAVGSTPTGGYSNPRLVLRPTDPAHPEIRGYDFLIDPPAPGSTITEAFVSHTATVASVGGSLPPVVRVYAAGNFVDATISFERN
jgi:hypothetical protein